MNRRSFLLGLATTVAATGIVPALPTPLTTNAELWYKQWLMDIIPILCDAQLNLLLYGNCAFLQVEDYPYIKSVGPDKIYQQA